MILLSEIVDHVKARLGMSHRALELDDSAIIQCLQQETLKTLSVYQPFYCTAHLNMEANRVTPNANTYYVPEVLGDDFIVTGVELVLPATTGQAAAGMFYMPAGSDIQTIIASYANTKLANTIASATINPDTHEFIEPNMIRMFNNYSLQNTMLILRTTHKKDFSTFPFGMLETIKDLAFYDVAMDVFSIRKYFANVHTIFAEIQLDMDLYSSIPDKRSDLIERMRKNQLKYSKTKKLFIA
jgi:hypothetical protein